MTEPLRGELGKEVGGDLEFGLCPGFSKEDF